MGSRLVSRFNEDGTVREGVEKALRKQDDIEDRKAARKAVDDNIFKSSQSKILKEAGKVPDYVHSSIYAALIARRNMTKGDTVLVVRRTTKEPVRLVIGTPDGRQESIPYVERIGGADFRVEDSLDEADRLKDWVEVDDRIFGERYYIVSRR